MTPFRISHALVINRIHLHTPRTKGKMPNRPRVNYIAPATQAMNKGAVYSTKHVENIIPSLDGIVEKVTYFKSRHQNLDAWYINPKNSQKMVMFVHGNGKNITNYQELYAQLLNDGFGIFAVEYRGHGFNPAAKVNEHNMSADVERAYKYLISKKGVAPENLVVLAHSMGGVLASNLVAKHPEIKSIVLVSPLNILELCKGFLTNPKVGLGFPERAYIISKSFKPLQWVQGLSFNTSRNLRHNQVPLTIIHSEHDNVTGIQGSKIIAAQAEVRGLLKGAYWLPKGGHELNAGKFGAVSDALRNVFGLPKRVDVTV